MRAIEYNKAALTEASPHPEKSFRFARNLGWSAVGQAGSAAASFLVIPFLIGRLGLEAYGLYLLMNMVTSYLLLLTFSAGTVTVIKTAELAAQRRGRAMSGLLAFSARLHLVGPALGAVALYFLAPALIGGFFKVPEALAADAVFVVRCGALGALLGSAAQFGTSLIQGLQRFDWFNAVALLQAAGLPLGAALLVWKGGSVRSVGLWYAALQAVCAVWAAALGLWLVRRLRLPDEGPALEKAGLVKNAGGLWLSQWAWLAANQFDKLFVGGLMTLDALTLYGVPVGLFQRLQVVPATIASITVPMVSGLTQAEKEEALPRMYLKSVRAILWSALPALAVLLALMPQFLTLWLGPRFGAESVWPARLVVMGQAAALFGLIPSTVAYSRGHPFYPTSAAWAQALVSVAAWTALAPTHGLLGVGAGYLIGQVSPLPLLLARVHRDIVRIGWGRYLRESVLSPVASAALLLAALLPLNQWAVDWPRLFLLGAAGFALYYGSTWLLMSQDDRTLLRRFLRYEGAA